jgi:signal peptidase I
VNYNKNYHDVVVELAKKKGVNVKRIFSDEDSENLFDKFKVMYVPACFVMKGDKIHKNLGSDVNPQSIQLALA